jgi:hypothetical protein
MHAAATLLAAEDSAPADLYDALQSPSTEDESLSWTGRAGNIFTMP